MYTVPFAVCLFMIDYLVTRERSDDYISLVLSVVCSSDQELYAVPIKISIKCNDSKYTHCPDVFLFYDQSGP